MPRSRTAYRCLALAAAAWIVPFGLASGAELKVIPPQSVLRGPDSVQQLVVETPDGRDLTIGAGFASADPKVATVDATGTVTAKGDGTTTVTVKVGADEVKAVVTVKEFHPGPPINFANQIVPIFTKLGCNSGGCHGKSGWQNGFRLSLLGFEPTLDYETLVKEGRGRRLFPAAPDSSLLLTKAVAKVPHGGGKKMEAGSHEYELVKRWVATGMPYGKAEDPTVARIEIYPQSRVLPRGAKQQLVVTAHYTDGSTEDVTRWAQYQSNEVDVATVAEGGLVEARQLAGQAAVMARYQGQVVVFRATVPLGEPIEKYPDFAPANFIDAAALKQWKMLGITPSDPCADSEFVRRASLDIIGTLPTGDETKAFVDSKDPEKRAKLVDALLERPEYSAYFATKWADLLRNKREGSVPLQTGTYRFYDWLRQNIAMNTPYDRIVAGVLAASGTPETAPPVVWYRKLRTPDAFVDDTAQVFLGMRLQCAKCHHHPFEKWSQDDYYGFAAFFGRVGRKTTAVSQRNGRADEAIYNLRSGSVSHPKTGANMTPKALGDKVMTVSAAEDPREKLVGWLADPSNPYFARALVNRYWAHFFGRGIVEPIDDMRVTNPASNPELLDALAGDFTKNGYDMKRLVRTICTSRVYGLSSVPNDRNAKDRQSFARHYPKRLSAEVLLDGISAVSGVPTDFGGLPKGTRAIELPDESVASTFLDTFGRPKRDTACECERVTDASLGQSLMLLNSNDVQSKLTAGGGRAEIYAAPDKDKRPDDQKIAELFWTAFGRPPSTAETTAAIKHLETHKDKRKEAYEDIIWALVNAKEFQFND